MLLKSAVRIFFKIENWDRFNLNNREFEFWSVNVRFSLAKRNLTNTLRSRDNHVSTGVMVLSCVKTSAWLLQPLAGREVT